MKTNKELDLLIEIEKTKQLSYLAGTNHIIDKMSKLSHSSQEKLADIIKRILERFT